MSEYGMGGKLLQILYTFKALSFYDAKEIAAHMSLRNQQKCVCI